MNRVLLVLAHPRPASLTGQVAARVRARLDRAGFDVDFLDLYAEDFDPRMRPEDEPDWADPGKPGSPEIERHKARIARCDHVLAVFPVWWSAPPAMLKGWIERTWTHGFAYTRDGSNLRTRSTLWLGLAGSSAEQFADAGLDDHLDRQLRVEVAQFCRIKCSRVRLIHDSVDAEDPHVLARIWRTTDAIAEEFIGHADQ
ncbi:NAD(P)H oxidoreductase [Allokutzneria sp. NRRL B-24872]|uniref:NAD(P)H oxidoreductase n=1 Tax=Allokutzneria sp. NRRL B-24872 TaxID=1137961 RepID=UPI000A379527|nr:NAD(P)H oxidoreductase [Allokutzneria sp. NRRL B-24872]